MKKIALNKFDPPNVQLNNQSLPEPTPMKLATRVHIPPQRLGDMGTKY